MRKGNPFTGEIGTFKLCQFASALAISCIWTAGALGETVQASADTHTRSNAPTANFGGDPTLRVRSGSHAGYLFFDLNSLASGEILGAMLRIRVRSATAPANIAIHEVLGSWGRQRSRTKQLHR